MLAIRLPESIKNRLAILSKKTGKAQTFYAKEAILNYIEDLEDYDLACERSNQPEKIISHASVKREFNVED